MSVPSVQAQDYTPLGLEFMIYNDGTVKVDYRVETDPTKVRVEVPLFGYNYEDVVIRNLEGLAIGSAETAMGLKVDTLGSLGVNITYYTSDLTTKIGLIWSFNVTAPIETWVTLPEGATVFGISDIPRDIATEDRRKSILLSPGDLSISYVVGLPSLRSDAREALDATEAYIADAKESGLILVEAEQLLEQGTQLFEDGEYDEAKRTAGQAYDSALGTVESAESAAQELEEASKAVVEARTEGRTSGLADVEERLQRAYEAYDDGDYEKAKSLATSANLDAVSAEEPSTSNLPLFGAVALIALAGAAYLYMKPRGFFGAADSQEVREVLARREEPVEVDLEAIFEDHADLRMDDREAIRFIAECGGEAFAYEIRERFDIPRSSAWRMIRRLVGMEVVEEVKVGNQSLIKIRKRYLGA
ncbi:MAG: hypothetical protein JSV27_09330 [Candidatus Bathyarchaeota archaeon]|nr:MAG: hypothetical protein JSV27_09330 [Candidatus Bathyarchaeota archaeon]